MKAAGELHTYNVPRIQGNKGRDCIIRIHLGLNAVDQVTQATEEALDRNASI